MSVVKVDQTHSNPSDDAATMVLTDDNFAAMLAIIPFIVWGVDEIWWAAERGFARRAMEVNNIHYDLLHNHFMN